MCFCYLTSHHKPPPPPQHTHTHTHTHTTKNKQTCIALYSFGTLAAYASMFASSTASVICSNALGTACDVYAAHPAPVCLSLYYVMMGVFAAIVVTLALKDMGDQAFVQKLLTGYRIVAFVVMLFTISVKLAADKDVLADRYVCVCEWVCVFGEGGKEEKEEGRGGGGGGGGYLVNFIKILFR